MNKEKNHRKSWIAILLGIAGACGLLALVLRPEKIPVDIATVRRGMVAVSISDDGITRVKERYTLTAPISGKMVRLEVHPGDPVRTDSGPIAILQPSDSDLLDPRTKLESEARVKAALASIQRADQLKSVAMENLELAEHEYQRASLLVQTHSVSQSEFDTIDHHYRIGKAEVRAAEFMRSVAEHELGVAQAVLKAGESEGGAPMSLTSPIDGLVLKVLREDAGYIPAGTAILEIGDPRDMEVLVDVLSTAAVSIQPGALAEIRGWGGPKPLSGRVRRVEPSAFLKISALGVEERRVNVLIDLDQPWEERRELGDGFRVDANIMVAKSEAEVLTAPTTAIEASEGKWYAYRIEKNPLGGYRVRRVAVEVGLSNRLETEILSGLEPGDRLVLYPPETIRDGSWVGVIENRESR